MSQAGVASMQLSCWVCCQGVSSLSVGHCRDLVHCRHAQTKVYQAEQNANRLRSVIFWSIRGLCVKKDVVKAF